MSNTPVSPTSNVQPNPAVKDPDSPNPIVKASAALVKAEEALLEAEPNLALSDAWGTIAKHWLSFVDPRDPVVRMMVTPKREGRR